jgi:hypothetical protein
MIKLIKLTTGDDVVCEYKDNEDGTITIENPAAFFTMQTEEGMQMGLAPWIPISKDKKFNISKDRIMVVSIPIDEIEQQYRTNFGSGLVVPNAPTQIKL